MKSGQDYYVMQNPSLNAGTHWLNEDRIFTYSRLLIYIYIAVFIGVCLVSRNGLMANGIPVGCDFIAFWSASYLWLHGNAVDAYDMTRLFEAQQAALPGVTANYAWFYPPNYYLIILPLGLLPYLFAYGAYVVSTLAFFLFVICRAIPTRQAVLLVIAFPAVFINAVGGQNGFLTAALAGLAVALLDARPVIAGILVGLLSIKPHLAVLFPIALIISGRWRAIFSSAITFLVFSVISYGIFGQRVFKAFFQSADFTRAALETGIAPWTKMPTAFASMRLLGFSLTASYTVHTLIALVAILGVALMWRKQTPYRLRASMLFTATFLISPYAYAYDLVWLAFPIAWMTLDGLQHGWLRWEREILLGAWLLPIVILVNSFDFHLPFGPFIMLALFGIILRRALLGTLTSTAAFR